MRLGAHSGDTGGLVQVYNKTGEDVVQLGVDEYGNGKVGAYNRKVLTTVYEKPPSHPSFGGGWGPCGFERGYSLKRPMV